ncbi:hypothetical protein BI364_07120 [Acidihalobacter yilgarnensis]|uniref:Lipoprotein n=1 Tax=Acidihalobacter yilgarnensis TaxID=2819280 RepID=A0A1D8IMR5_9GAMM|nr:hypothetical protein [Acidihalobacter yilgarnensis]AOU97763.1 hypothetical protein BI364_07120 [Acidihalobacter yilgarnensis]
MIRPLALAAALLGLLALGGCAFNHGVTLNNPPPASKTAFLKGRAFTVGKVTVAPDARPVHETVYHCLPDPMYAKMMKYNIELAFQRAGLTQGKGPAVPVNFEITLRTFKENGFSEGLGATGLRGYLTFAGFRVHMNLRGVGVANDKYYDNTGPYWTRQEDILPAMAAAITAGIKGVQHGKSFYRNLDFFGSDNVGGYFGDAGTFTHHIVTLPYPMTVKEYEQITGKSAAQLAAICKARIAGK